MKTPRLRLCPRLLPVALSLVLGVCAADAAPRMSDADDDVEWVFDPHDFYEQWLAWRLSLGVTLTKARVRHRHVPYDPEQEHNFLGNINDMREHFVYGLSLNYIF